MTPFLLIPALIFQGFGLANFYNSSVSLVSEMIGQDDEASAIVLAAFNILESSSNAIVVFIIMAYKYCDYESSLKVIVALIPILCGSLAFIISKLRFKNIADQYSKF